MTTILGSRNIEVTSSEGATETVSIHQISLKDYERAFAAIDDEFELAAIVTGRDKKFILSLSPESYESVRIILEEINGGFFVYADRQMAKLAKRLNSMSAHVIAAAKAKADEKPSNNSRHGLQPQ
jgi:hypothetical protein